MTCRIISFGEYDFDSAGSFVADFLTSFSRQARQDTEIRKEYLPSRPLRPSSHAGAIKRWDRKEAVMSSSLRTTKPCAQCLTAIRARRPAETTASIAGPSNYQSYITAASPPKRRSRLASTRASASPPSLRGDFYQVRDLRKTVKTAI